MICLDLPLVVFKWAYPMFGLQTKGIEPMPHMPNRARQHPMPCVGEGGRSSRTPVQISTTWVPLRDALL